MIDFYPNIMSEDEREEYLLELYPMYIPPSRIPQPVEPEPQQESPAVIEDIPEIAAPSIETDEPVAAEPERYSALAYVYASARSPLGCD